MEGEKKLDTSTDELLQLISMFGIKHGYNNKQMIVLMLWSLSISIEANVALEGGQNAETYKEGLRQLISEIDGILRANER